MNRRARGVRYARMRCRMVWHETLCTTREAQLSAAFRNPQSVTQVYIIGRHITSTHRPMGGRHAEREQTRPERDARLHGLAQTGSGAICFWRSGASIFDGHTVRRPSRCPGSRRRGGGALLCGRDAHRGFSAPDPRGGHAHRVAIAWRAVTGRRFRCGCWR